MDRLTRWIFGVTITFAGVANLAVAAPSLDDPLIVEAYVDGIVKPLMASNNSPSGTVAIMHNGEMILAKGYGFEDIKEQTPVDAYTTLFRPGSVSKLFTWVAVMQQVEEGKLDLDTDVNEYLEGFQIADTFDEPITLRHIMTHTSGFEDGALGYLIVDDPQKAVSLREAMERYQPRRVNPPGVQTAYSNYATALAGLIVANVSGVPFQDYIQQFIFNPLGMQNSSFVEPLPEGLDEHMATSYKADGGTFVEKPFEIIASFAPAGSQSATSTDMVRFGQAMLSGGELDNNRILEADTAAAMLSNEFSHDDRLMGMALGFYASDYNGYRVMGHGGDTQYFHSYLGIDQKNGLVFFVSFGSGGGSAVRSAFAPAFYDEFFPVDEVPPVAPEDFAERAGKYAGTYAFWRGNFSTIEKAFGLVSVIQVAPTKENTLMVAFSGNAKQYVEVEDKLFRELDPGISLIAGFSPRLLAFQENDAGQVTGFVLDGLPFMSLRKLPAYATPSFNFALLGFSLLVMLAVVLRRFYQRKQIQAFSADDRSAVNAAVYASSANLLTIVVGGIVLSVVMDKLFMGIPLLFKLWLILPIVATLAGIYLLYRSYSVWSQRLLGGFWPRARFTVVTFCALFMVWFYWYWNILGYQYL